MEGDLGSSGLASILRVHCGASLPARYGSDRAVSRPLRCPISEPASTRTTGRSQAVGARVGEVRGADTVRVESAPEVALIVGIPEATVKTRMFYARKNLAEMVRAA